MEEHQNDASKSVWLDLFRYLLYERQTQSSENDRLIMQRTLTNISSYKSFNEDDICDIRSRK